MAAAPNTRSCHLLHAASSPGSGHRRNCFSAADHAGEAVADAFKAAAEACAKVAETTTEAVAAVAAATAAAAAHVGEDVADAVGDRLYRDVASGRRNVAKRQGRRRPAYGRALSVLVSLLPCSDLYASSFPVGHSRALTWLACAQKDLAQSTVQ